MLNLSNTTTAQTLRIPLMYRPQHDTFTLRLFSITDNEAKADLTLDDATLSHAYLKGTVELPEGLPDGEYSYALRCGGDALSCGLVTIGDYKHTPATYHETIQFKQYAS